MYAARRLVPILILIGGLGLTGLSACSSASTKASHSYSPPTQTRASHRQARTESLGSADSAPASYSASAASAREPSVSERHAVSGGVGSGSSTSGAKAPQAKAPEVEKEPTEGQLLIYSGAIVLAIYEVDKTQDQAIALVDEMGGYVSNRTSTTLTARVPAAKFRSAMEQFGELGDVLDRSWKAQDVTDQVRDLDIRLRNALGLRDRLEALLDDAESVEDALKIEKELERITLEIERIRGQLKGFKDRIAYSTIEVSFSAKRTNDVPKEDFLLPFNWLNTLGLQSLLRSPQVYR